MKIGVAEDSFELDGIRYFVNQSINSLVKVAAEIFGKKPIHIDKLVSLGHS
jgi:hypothetical protein